ncbi:hypothetical protein D1007_51316 [Hordeum vulgare]|nr:hypothetical protein D1007_51316 [Hordeum vulgare]
MGKFHSNGKDQAKLDKLFLSTALDQLEEFTFNDRHIRSLSPSVIRLTPTMHIARFMNYHFPQINADPALLLPRVKHLELVAIYIPNDDMEHVLHGCTALEYLHLHAVNGLSSLHIAFMSLRTICVYCCCCNKRSHKLNHQMVNEDVLVLERLLVVDQQGPTRIRVIYTLKLTIFGYSHVNFSKLVIGSITIQVQ